MVNDKSTMQQLTGKTGNSKLKILISKVSIIKVVNLTSH
jgi:hypothetical protein